MQNGYAFANKDGLRYITNHINNLNSRSYENLKGKLKIGIQWKTEVTIGNAETYVSQIYCSALPIGYSSIPHEYWEVFAKLILNATYEATFYAALKNYSQTGNRNLYLTLVGGGAFENDLSWIIQAIEGCLIKFQNTPLDVKIVSYGSSNKAVQDLIKKIYNKI